MIKKAMILAAGYGKRLRPLTENCPKPLLKIGKKTLLSNTINFLEQSEIEEVVINVHYLGEKIIEYINKKNFKIKINIIKEKDKILDTGGGILNALKYFNESFLCINPDTVWNLDYVKELKQMKNNFLSNNKKCLLMVIDKTRSFDKNLKGDFNLKNELINRTKDEELKYIYTGLQIINPEVFLNIKEEVFSINKIWNKLIQNNELYAFESSINFLHASNLEIYKKLNIK
tara:strand:+ start:1096 stop:1785 length:690 start_codon:yes stop_codon:yes gene_type:complete